MMQTAPAAVSPKPSDVQHIANSPPDALSMAGIGTCAARWFSSQHAPLRLNRQRFDLRAEQALVGNAQPAADFAADVHLDQRKLLEVALVDLEKSGCRQFDRRASFRCTHRGAAWKQIHQRHLAEAVAL